MHFFCYCKNEIAGYSIRDNFRFLENYLKVLVSTGSGAFTGAAAICSTLELLDFIAIIFQITFLRLLKESYQKKITGVFSMQFEKFLISRDPKWYHAWPDVSLAGDGTLICVFNECTHHLNREHTRVMLCESHDRGRTWTAKHPLTEATDGLSYYYNCPRIFKIDNRIGVIVDRIPSSGENENGLDRSVNVIYWSSDCGKTWSGPEILPLCGIVPDKIHVLDTGRWLASAQKMHQGTLSQFLRYSDDNGKTWSDEILVAHDPLYQLCEVSLLSMGNGVVAAFLRENSWQGLDCFKTVSHDNGETWGPLAKFPLPGCHRPVSGFLNDGRIFITYRFMQGGIRKNMSTAMQNFFCALTDRESVLADKRELAQTRIIPLDYDRSDKADLGYSGWVQFEDGEIYIVNYIVDDAVDKGQIRGYSLRLENTDHSVQEEK